MNGTFPFEGILTGALNCVTREFTGKLVGCYAVGVGLGVNEGRFEGPVTGIYDDTTHQLTMGTWDVLEKDVHSGWVGMIGGDGDWDATHNSMPTSAGPLGVPRCAIGAGVALDAGL